MSLWETTDKLTSDTFVMKGNGAYYGLKIGTDGTNDVRVVVYDNVEASGKVIDDITVTGSDYYGGAFMAGGDKVYNGIYIDITGTNGFCWVKYNPFARAGD